MSDEYQSPFFNDDDNISSSSSANSDELFSNENQIDLNSFADSNNQTEQVNAKRKKNKKSKTTKQKVLKTVLSVCLIFVITMCLVVGSFLIYVFGFIDDSIDVNLFDMDQAYTTTIYVKDSKTGEYSEYQRLHGGVNRIWVSYDKEKAEAEDPEYTGIPKRLADAFVAIEDETFYSHGGVNWKRTFAAFLNMFVEIYSSNQGGSTITQQLVKNVTWDTEQTGMRKIREIMRARRIEKTVNKDTILECYLNTITFANGIGGVEVAANYYYNKSVADLTLAECAGLASIIKEPERYRPDKYPENNAERRKLVLGKMLELEYITEEEYEQALAEEVKIVADKETIKEVETNNYFVDALIDNVVDGLVEKYNCDEAYAEQKFYNGGYKIYCTMDTKIQATLEKYYTDLSHFSKNKKGVTAQSSFTVMDYSGHVVGIVGGVGEKKGNRSLNRATSSPRQPGSSIKPISVYSLALDQNIISYSSLLKDAPTQTIVNSKGKKVKWPYNAGGSCTNGMVTMARALEKSYNTIPVQLIEKMGIENVFDHAVNNMGLKNLVAPEQAADKVGDHTYSSLGLGGCYKGITTLESCAAFATIGNKGKYYEPTFYTKITDQHGEVVLESNKKPKIAMMEDTSVILNKMLQNVVNQGTGTSIKSYLPNMKVFGKTGTTDDNYNLWFAGGTPYYVASCWYGYDQQEKVSESGAAKRVWGNIMKEIHKGLDVDVDFPDSEYVTYRKYCTSSGMLATERCSSTALGWYKTSQLKPCTTHGGSVLGEVDPSAVNTSSNATSSEENTSSNTSSNKTSSNTSSNKTSSTTTNSSKPAEATDSKPVETTTSTPAQSTTTSEQTGETQQTVE
ncbi:MAG: penicillin-binding protein [Ruminococcaceae bacterium]|nr:penicillin-binding protein [Oscillospiraceae bacterium]